MMMKLRRRALEVVVLVGESLTRIWDRALQLTVWMLQGTLEVVALEDQQFRQILLATLIAWRWMMMRRRTTTMIPRKMSLPRNVADRDDLTHSIKWLFHH